MDGRNIRRHHPEALSMNVRSRKKSVKHVTFKTEREMAAWMAKKIAGAKKEVILVLGEVR